METKEKFPEDLLAAYAVPGLAEEISLAQTRLTVALHGILLGLMLVALIVIGYVCHNQSQRIATLEAQMRTIPVDLVDYD
jgi:cytochrome b561